MKKCYSTSFSYFSIRNYVARAFTFYSTRSCIFFYNNRLSFTNLVCVKSTVEKLEDFPAAKPKLDKATSTFNFASLSSAPIWLEKFCIVEMKLLKK